MSEHDQSVDVRRLAEAAAWRSALFDIDAETTVEFEAWLAADVANKAAWERLNASWSYVGDHATSPELLAARQAALQDARYAPLRRRKTVVRSRMVAAAAVFGVGLAALIATVALRDDQDVYQTAIGEHRVVTLKDGSHVVLDADSEVDVRMSENARDLHLRKGRARFEVTHDVQRPFAVTAGSRKVVATGTVFDVDLFESRLEVTLIEGHVEVLDHRQDGSSPMPAGFVQLNPGDRLIAEPRTGSTIVQVDLSRVSAWEQGQIVVEDMPLKELISRMKRYTATHIDIMDERAASIRVSGAFDARNVYGFVDTLTHYFPLEVSTDSQGTLRLRSRD